MTGAGGTSAADTSGTEFEGFAGYVLEKMLGRGGMAEVFRAQAADGPKVALKRLLPRFADKPERVALFLEETRIARQLSHPNIVRVLDSGEHGGCCFLVLELVDGMDLRGLCTELARQAQREGPSYRGQERGVLPPALAAFIGIRAAEGLAYMHGLEPGVIHRDIGPTNILVDLGCGDDLGPGEILHHVDVMGDASRSGMAEGFHHGAAVAMDQSTSGSKRPAFR